MMEENKRKKKKRTIGDVIRIILLLIAVGIFCYAGYSLLQIYLEYKSGTDEYRSLDEFVKEVEIPGGTDENGDSKGDKDSQDYVSGDLGKERTMESPVDFAGLKKINEEVIGWINIEALDISYPMVRGKDNDFYLHNTFKKVPNIAGAIFMDYECETDFTDQNTLIYGHNMKNGSMFGTLKKFREEDAYKKSPYFWIYTPKVNYKYEIFSVHEVGAVGNNYQISFKGDKEFEKYIDDAVKGSEVKNSVEVGVEDRLVTLSTCTGNEATRLIVQAKLVDEIKVRKS